MMNYEIVTAEEGLSITRTRVHELERAHFRTRLLLAEAVTPVELTALRTDLAELERRHAVHVADDPVDPAKAANTPVGEQGETAQPSPARQAAGPEDE